MTMHEWLKNLTQTRCWQTHAYWGGEWHAGPGRYPVRNPATGETIAEVADCGRSETEAAIDAAAHAFSTWKNTLAKERSALLRQWHARIIENAESLAQLIMLECGKPLAEARGEVAYAASFVEWFAEEAKRVYGDLIPTPQADRRLMAWKQPVGVCAAITPWNFPAAMITRKVAPALAVGCTVVVKPAEQTPLTALALAALAEDAGFPAGSRSPLDGAMRSDVEAPLV
jgi:succinate-semialdehyde dehydrogenase/glutarate-semialdehyde dehydrogenase